MNDEHNSTIGFFLGADLEDKVSDALSDFNKMMEAIGGCTDGNCVIVRPKGMHTNGGCRCTRDYIKMQQYVNVTRRLHSTLKSLVDFTGREE